MTELKGKVALVTGASSGIGLAVAKKLCAEGAKVGLVARTAARLEELARELGAEKAAAFPCDVANLTALAALPAAVAARFGGLDVVVNNAGVNHRGPIYAHPPEVLVEILTTNLTAPVVLTRAAVDHLRPGGAIVNVASLAGMIPVGHEATYSASKSGLRAFSRAAAQDLAERKITVSSVCPGPVDTAFFGDVASVPDLVFSQPMRSPEQIADAVLDCIRDGTAEVALPALSGKLATVAYLFPALERAIRPLVERRGAARKKAYLARKG
jgi:short-subunit dehydrogenase